MLRLASVGVFALVLSVGAFVSPAAAFEGAVHPTSLAAIGKAGHMAELPAWLINWLGNLNGGNNGGNNGGSVPVPGTLLAFGLGFAGLAAWRAVQSRR